ncbi:hypothetical protein EW145_g2425 [Phellinidium pouzarii]|uniref:BTB domain-containing protein n=1 Tax=Phellinidium pouzarii TaxID=167371 RepID=A0A4S4LAX6_9AGAM|nr:hypothetical protein EW145_g2425 [Phellinidium pouzarii]
MKLYALRVEPKRRELLVILLLFLTFLYLKQSYYFDSSTSANEKVVVAETLRDDVVPVEESFAVSYPESDLSWTVRVPESTIVAHVPGWTIFDKLYAMNGTLFIVTSFPDIIPERKLLTSSGYEVFNGEEEKRKRLPSDKDIQVISPKEAQRLFGTHEATHFDGVSFFVNDPRQFIAHYYHWTAELIFGIWRTYSSLDPYITANGHTTLPPPKRMMFSHVSGAKWRDYAGMNQWVTRGAFPSLGMEFMEDWEDRAAMQTLFVFDRVVLADRAAASEGDPFKKTWRTASNAFELGGSPNWWAPVRRSVLQFSGLPAEWIVGPDPGTVTENQKLVITYISRQGWGRRMMRPADHDKLVEELYGLRDKYGYEVNVVNMEKLSRVEQFQLAGRTTVMMGVHGNGLTSLVWMRPTSRSTVIEFFTPQGLAFDYEYTTRALGMTHYGVWDNVTFTRPDVPRFPKYPDDFHGIDIPVDGAVVARLVHRHFILLYLRSSVLTHAARFFFMSDFETETSSQVEDSDDSGLVEVTIAPAQPFDSLDDTDIILRTSDAVDFRVMKVILSLSSPIFKYMFSLPQPSYEEGDLSSSSSGIPIVTISESSTVLDTLLRICYPIESPQLGDCKDISFDAFGAARKYDISIAIGFARKALRKYIKTNSKNVVTAFAVACHFKLEDGARAAAKEYLKLPSPGPAVPALSLLTGLDYYHLLDYHTRVTTDTVSLSTLARHLEESNCEFCKTQVLYDWEETEELIKCAIKEEADKVELVLPWL